MQEETYTCKNRAYHYEKEDISIIFTEQIMKKMS